MPYAGYNENTPGFMTLDALVADVQLMLDKYDTRDALRFKQFTIRGVGDLHLCHVSMPRTEFLEVPDSKVIALPDDFIEYVSAGYVDDNGKYIELGRNINLPPLEVISNGTDVINHSGVGDKYQGFPGYGNYGIGGGAATSYYKIDYENRLMYLNRPIPGDEIVLQYKSTGIAMPDTTAYISKAYREVLIAWVLWKQSEVADGFTRGDRLDRERRYWSEVEKVRAVEGSFTESELRDVIYSTKTQSK